LLQVFFYNPNSGLAPKHLAQEPQVAALANRKTFKLTKKSSIKQANSSGILRLCALRYPADSKTCLPRFPNKKLGAAKINYRACGYMEAVKPVCILKSAADTQ